ncbi:MAG TPA: HYR domain-containing protein [Verrucomicrobiae bacterium]|nr:HYR domain-containing protein [Verrucomicrobiae bacterium]
MKRWNVLGMRGSGPELGRIVNHLVRSAAIFGMLLAAVVLPAGVQAVALPGTVVAWGWDQYGQTNVPTSVTNAIDVACDDYGIIALLASGQIIGWGADFGGSLDAPVGLSNVVALAGATEDSAALLGNGTVVAWGYGADGGTNVPASVTNAVAIAGGGYHFLALLANGQVVGWGTNSNGEISIPSGVTNATAISAGYTHSMALLSSGQVIAWGNNAFGETNVPASVTNAVAISAGYFYSMALLANSNVVAWGYALAGATNVPTFVTNAVAIAAGQLAGYAQLADGTVVGWGTDDRGETNIPSNVIFPSVLSGGAYHAAALLSPLPAILTCPTSPDSGCLSTSDNPSDISVHVHDVRGYPLTVAWYVNGTGVESTNIAASSGGPTDTDIVFQAEARNFGPYEVFASVDNGAFPAFSCSTYVEAASPGPVEAWGDTSDGEANVPAAATNAISIAAGFNHALALLPTGEVIAWGDNTYGETNVPANVTDAVAISAGVGDSAALLANGNVVVWGYNGYFQTNVPAGVSEAVAINANYYNVQAVLADGSLIEWGTTSGNVTNVPAAATNVVASASGSESSIALLSNGQVIGWGFDAQGELNVPAAVTNATAIAAGGFHYLALLADGSVVAWGNNTYGQTNVPASVTNAVGVAAGDFFSLALLGNGSVVAWGSATNGETDVTADLTDATAIAAGGDHALAMHALPMSLVGPASTNILCHASYTDPGIGASVVGPCGDVVTSITTNSDLDTMAPGRYSVSYTATLDEWSRSVTRMVTVVDTNVPVPNVGSLPTLTGQCSVDVTNVPTAGDACDPTIVATTEDPTNYVSQGTNTIHWTYNNFSGTVVTQLQTVVVADTIAPMIDCPSDIVVDASNGASVEVSFALPTATDNCSTNPGVVCVPPSGSIFNAGTNTVMVTATDDVGNQSHCAFHVIVRGPLLQNELALSEVYELLAQTLSKVDNTKLQQISKTLTNAVVSASWTDTDHPTAKGGKTVFHDDQHSTQDLLTLLKTNGNGLGTNVVESVAVELVQAARNTALIAIRDAQLGNGNAKLVAAANTLMGQGDTALAAGRPQIAVADYGKAWQDAVKSLQ